MQNQAKLTVAIAEDNEIFALGLETIIIAHPLLRHVGTYYEGSDIVDAMPSLTPGLDLIFMDVCMPRMSGIEATKKIKACYPNVRIVAISMFDEVNLIEEMLDAGADSYLLKDDFKIKKLDELVQTFMDNKRYVSPAAAMKYVLHKFSSEIHSKDEKRVENPKLKNDFHITVREYEIIECIIAGMSNKQMAEELNISKSTIQTHKKNIMTKTGAQNSLQIAKWANENGI